MVAKTTENPQREELKQKFVDRLQLECSVSPDEVLTSRSIRCCLP